MTNSSDYIVPTKENLVFLASCDYFGYIDGPYKGYIDEATNCVTNSTWATNYKEAILDLLDWIDENPSIIEEYPKAKFEILLVDGTRKNGEMQHKRVYFITARDAKKYFSI